MRFVICCYDFRMLWRFLPRAMAVIMLAAGLASSIPVSACYSGLVVIPTADVVEPGVYSIEAQYDGAFAHKHDDTWILNTQLGLAPGLEFGVDYDFSKDAQTRTLLNAKYAIPLKMRNSALALGACNVGRRSKGTPFAVASIDLNVVRGHLGVAGIDGTGRWFTGFDKAVTDDVTLMADYTNGDENSSSVGLSYQFNHQSGITAGAVFPNAGGSTEFTIHFVFSSSFGSTEKRS